MMRAIRPLRTVLDKGPFLWVGHRGDGKNGTSPHIENTMASFNDAFVNGANMIETDCQLTADNRVVLWHNDTIAQNDVTNPNFQESAIPDKTYAELMALELQNPVTGVVTDEKIVGLDSLLDRFGESIYYYLELKVSETYSEEQVQILCKETVQIVRQSGLLETTLFVSFDPRALELCYKENKDLLLGLNLERETMNRPAPEVPIAVLCPDLDIVLESRVKKWGGALMPSNVTTKDDLMLCKEHFCKGATTDYLNLIQEIA